jgi:hypothetical protein
MVWLLIPLIFGIIVSGSYFRRRCPTFGFSNTLDAIGGTFIPDFLNNPG